ncbi:MAG: insulinase family protein [Pirellulales bacterium]|nr:insulinase family protein [Pirellulales bacterium]
MKFLQHTLSNGLEIVAECNGDAHSAAVGFFVRTGSRDETDAVSGVSHFLEHMLFKGTPTRSADDVNREFDEMGAHYNAFTNEENTVYYAAVLPEYLGRAVELWADVLRPSLREDDFNTEKKVIIEEIKMYEDQPPFCADEKCRAAFFGPHPLGRSVLGSETSIAALPVEAMRGYFDRRYSPGNILLAAVGKIDFDALVQTAENRCGQWTPVSTNRAFTSSTPQENFLVEHKESAFQQYVLQLAPGPAAEDDDRHAAKLLAVILGDDSGSRLYWELVDPGLAEQATLSHGEYQGAGMMATYMSCDPERAEENLQIIRDIYRRAQTEGVAENELAQAKSKVRSHLVLGSERPRGRLFPVGGDWVYRRQYRPIELELRTFAEVGLAEVNAVLQKYPLEKCTTLTIGPLAAVKEPK